MQLDHLSVNLRPRLPWEAMDLGIALWRKSFRAMTLAWLVMIVPLWAVLMLMFRETPWLILLASWWLKPLYDRILLVVYSRQVFGDTPGVREIYAAWREILGGGLLSCLTVYRLDPGRAFNLAVWQLERLRGQKRWDRSALLNTGHRGHAMALTFILGLFSFMVLFSLLLIPWILLPEQLTYNMEDALGLIFNLSDLGFLWFVPVTIWLFTIFLLEPVYLAAGFTHYLSRRVDLEGWDIEVRFRRMEQRLSKVAGIVSSALLLVILIAPGSATAQDVTPDPDAVKAELEAVYEGDAIYVTWEETKWRSGREAKPDRVDTPSDSRSVNVSLLAWLLKWFLVIALVAGIGYLLSQHRRIRALLGGESNRQLKQPVTQVSGLDIRRDSLPNDIPAAAMAAIREGRFDLALSLLYRGALSRLVLDAEVAIRESDTEGDCVNRVNAQCPAGIRDYFYNLTQHWISLAYGHHPLHESTVTSMVEGWREQFDGTRLEAQS